MGERHDDVAIPPGTYEIDFGPSFAEQGRKDVHTLHTMRYDFKPQSVATTEPETYIAYGTTADVTVAVPKEDDGLTVFKGAKKEAKRTECLLFYDKTTGQMRLEKISSNIHLKKTRDVEPADEAQMKTQIQNLRASRRPKQLSSSTAVGGGDVNRLEDRTDVSSSSSDSASGSGSDSDSGSEDEAPVGRKYLARRHSSSNSDNDELENCLLEKMQQGSSGVSSGSSTQPMHSTIADDVTGLFSGLGSSQMEEPMKPPPPQPKQKSAHNDLFGLNLSDSSDED